MGQWAHKFKLTS